MGGGKGGSKRQVYDFLLSMDYGVCHGPIDRFNTIEMKDKAFFTGPVANQGAFSVDKPDLYGGDDGEGGPQGAIEFYMGTYDQVMTDQLAGRFGKKSNEITGYPGVAHVFFRGNKDAPGADSGSVGTGGFFYTVASLLTYALSAAVKGDGFGFKWTSNNPYLPTSSVRATRGPVGLSQKYVYPITGIDGSGEYTIAAPGDDFTDGVFDPTKAPDANPAAMIYEAMVNPDWGKGEPESMMNVESFEAAATILNAEHFGLSMRWMQQSSIEKFVSEVLDHIKGILFQDRDDGKWTLKLIRDDYTLSECRLVNDKNANVETIKQRVWGETINHIQVSYTDPVSEENEVVPAWNEVNVAIQGGVISETRDYHGVRNPWLAKIIAERDVSEASRTVINATLMCDRSFADTRPGDVLRFTWPEDEIEELAVRVIRVGIKGKSERNIKLEVTEDIFSARRVTTPATVVPDPGPTEIPSPVDNQFIMVPPLPLITAYGISAEDIDAEFPVAYVAFLLNDVPTPLVNVQVESDITLPNGDPAIGQVATVPETRNYNLNVNLDPEVKSIIPEVVFEKILKTTPPEIGMLFIIGETEDVHEIIMLNSYDSGNEEWEVLRGMYDTVPLTWVNTDQIWRMPTSISYIDQTDRIPGTEYSFWPRARTSVGLLDLGSTPEVLFTPSYRLHQPFRPANVKVAGQLWDDVQYLAGAVPASIEITWSNRNRLSEDAVGLAWDAGSVTPEVGQTTTIQFYDTLDETLEFEVTGLTGTSYTLDPDDLPNYRFYRMEIFSVRDGIESYHRLTRNIELERVGYGANYDYDYDENDGE